MSLARQRELVVLATLQAHPLHGYALVEVLSRGLGPAVDLKPANVYAILKRFEERGWIAGAVDHDGAARTVYTVTAEGAAAVPGLAHTAARTASSTPVPLAVAIAHLDQVPADARPALMASLVDVRHERLAELAAWEGHPGMLGAAIDLLRRQVELEVEVLEDLSTKASAHIHDP